MLLHLVISIIGILVTIFFVIGTHEFAHFQVARLLNIKVLRFSIGFGKTLLHWHDKKGTEYVVALIPLGGYVKMLDEGEGEVKKEELHLAFNRQPFYKKFLVVIAGPLANIFCAFVLYWLIFTIGFTAIKPIIGSVIPHSIAADAGLKAGQEIVSIDNEPTKTWTSILFRLISYLGNESHLKVDVKIPEENRIESRVLNLSNWQMDGLSPDPFTSIGIKPYEIKPPLVIGAIADKSPALHSPLRMGDKIIAVNQKPINTWMALITEITKHPNQSLTFTVKRNNKTLNIPVMIGHQRNLFLQKTGYLGIGPYFKWPKELLQHMKYSPLAALPEAWNEIVNFTYFNFLLFGKLITGKLSLQSLGGPIMIFETAGDALNSGLLAFLAFLAFLSIAIGVINIIPISGLDGGHILIQLIELIIRRPLPEKVLMMLYRLGMLFILSILVIAITNDLMRVGT